MFAGYDKMQGFQLYCSDPSGNYGAWLAHATGKNSAIAKSTLKDEYNEGCTMKEALTLAVKILGKSMDSGKKDAKRYEVGMLTKEGKSVCQRVLDVQDVEPLIAAADFDKEE